LSEFSFDPRPHKSGSHFVVGRLARPDPAKWSSEIWSIYRRIPYSRLRARVMGWDGRVEAKCGPSPIWAETLPPAAEPVRSFLSSLHCLVSVNGGAEENWPRVGLECMAAGVPIVAERSWGWPELVEHGITGYLGEDGDELAFHAAHLAYEEDLRIAVVSAARTRLRLLCEPSNLGRLWSALLQAPS
jgi:glycosyltransferase involved in cell wall biosynthesis